MGYLVALLGLAIAVIGLVGVVEPKKLTGLVRRFWTGERSLYIASGLRIAMGTLLILAAPWTNFPPLISVLGIVTFVAGIGLMLLGYDRVDRLIRWFLARPTSLVRVSSLLAISFGVVLLFAGM